MYNYLYKLIISPVFQRTVSSETPSCPICLQIPQAGNMFVLYISTEVLDFSYFTYYEEINLKIH